MTDNPEHAGGSVPLPNAEQQSPERTEGPPRESSVPHGKIGWAGQLAMICLGVVAGAVASEVIYRSQEIIPGPPLEGGPGFPPEVLAAVARAQLASMAAAFGLAGAWLAALLGGGLWLISGAKRVALSSALIGLLAGALFGALGGALNTLLYRQLVGVALDDLFRSMAVHAPFWICLSIAVGLAVGLPLREISTAKVIGATFGAAILTSLLYPLVSTLPFPATRTELVVPIDRGSRILWIALGAGLMAWAATRSVPSRA